MLIIVVLLVLRISAYMLRTIFGVSSQTEKSLESTETLESGLRKPIVIQDQIDGDRNENKEKLDPDFTLAVVNSVDGKMGIDEEGNLSSSKTIELEQLEDRIREKLGIDKFVNGVAGRFEPSASRFAEDNLIELDAQRDVLNSLRGLQRALVGHENYSNDQGNTEVELKEKKTTLAERLEDEVTENDRGTGSGLPATSGPLLATLVSLEESLKVNERLAQKDPASSMAQRNVAMSMSQLAEILIEVGDLSGAITLFEKTLGISERLAQQNSASADALRDVAVSLNRLGDALVQKGDIETANKQFDMGLNISQHLAEQNPTNVQAQRDVWFSLNRIGDMRVKTDNILAAVIFFEAGLQITQRLAKYNPKNVQAQRDLIVSLAKLGEVSPDQGWWAKGLSICERLLNEGVLPESDSWMLDDLYRRSVTDRLP